MDAVCTELTVGGLTLEADCVPCRGEILEVLVASRRGGIVRPPLRVRAVVRRCPPCEGGHYRIGLETLDGLG